MKSLVMLCYPVFAIALLLATFTPSVADEPAVKESPGTESPATKSTPEIKSETTPSEKEGWIRLFDGKTLDGWKAAESPKSFVVKDGVIVVDGPKGHLYYQGDVEKHNFKNFEFRAEVLTKPKANSGLYIHTHFLEKGWPNTGYEAQVNTSHHDPKKTGSLYNVVNVKKKLVEDNKWYRYDIIVRGKRIVIKINGKTVVDYTEPADLKRPERQLSSGTFAIQAHDPKSVIHYRNIFVRPLKD